MNGSIDNYLLRNINTSLNVSLLNLNKGTRSFTATSSNNISLYNEISFSTSLFSYDINGTGSPTILIGGVLDNRNYNNLVNQISIGNLFSSNTGILTDNTLNISNLYLTHSYKLESVSISSTTPIIGGGGGGSTILPPSTELCEKINMTILSKDWSADKCNVVHIVPIQKQSTILYISSGYIPYGIHTLFYVGQKVHFGGIAYSSAGIEADNYRWTYNNINIGNAPRITHIFTKISSGEIKLTVTDNAGITYISGREIDILSETLTPTIISTGYNSVLNSTTTVLHEAANTTVKTVNKIIDILPLKNESKSNIKNSLKNSIYYIIHNTEHLSHTILTALENIIPSRKNYNGKLQNKIINTTYNTMKKVNNAAEKLHNATEITPVSHKGNEKIFNSIIQYKNSVISVLSAPRNRKYYPIGFISVIIFSLISIFIFKYKNNGGGLYG